MNHSPSPPYDPAALLAVTADLRSGLRKGKPLRLRVERGGRETDLTGTLDPWTRQVLTIVEDESASGAQAAVREGIFSGERRETARADD